MNADALPVSLRSYQEALSLGRAGGLAENQNEFKVLKCGRVELVRYPGVIKVLRGTVWLTGTPAREDVILRTGESFRMERNFPFVIEGLREAEVMVIED